MKLTYPFKSLLLQADRYDSLLWSIRLFMRTWRELEIILYIYAGFYYRELNDLNYIIDNQIHISIMQVAMFTLRLSKLNKFNMMTQYVNVIKYINRKFQYANLIQSLHFEVRKLKYILFNIINKLNFKYIII